MHNTNKKKKETYRIDNQSIKNICVWYGQNNVFPLPNTNLIHFTYILTLNFLARTLLFTRSHTHIHILNIILLHKIDT